METIPSFEKLKGIIKKPEIKPIRRNKMDRKFER
jgi:hypothetical protein